MNLINTIGWTLVHFLWQGTLIALALAAVQGLLRNATARARYAVACGAMMLMLICAVATFASLRTPVSVTEPSSAPAAATSAMPMPSAVDSTFRTVPSTRDLSRLLPWLVYFWMAGVSLLTLRSLGGWVVLQGFKRREVRPAEPVWQQRLARLGRRLRISRPVRLCESTLARVPSVVGWMRPVILMPVCALNGLTPEQLEGLLAHELAHIRQYDYLVNLFQTCVETLLFYHPAVWWVGNRIRVERENCCDDLAVEVCGDALAYARALAQLEQIRCDAPQLAMAANGGSLLQRVQRLLSSRPSTRVAPAGWMAGAALALVAIIGWASPRLERSTSQPVTQPIQQSVTAPQAVWPASGEEAIAVRDARLAELAAKTERLIRVAKDERVIRDERVRALMLERMPSLLETIPRVQTVTETQQQRLEDGQPPVRLRAIPNQPMAALMLNTDTKTVYETIGKLAGINVLFDRDYTSRQLTVRLRNVTLQEALDTVALQSRTSWRPVTPNTIFVAQAAAPVTPSAPAGGSFLEEMDKAGYHNLSVDQLIALKIHGVNADFIRDIRAAGYQPTAEQLVTLKIHAITPQYIQQFKSRDWKLDIDRLVALRIHGVDPAQLDQMASLGYKLNPDEAVAMRIHGVTPEFISHTKELGLGNPTFEQLMALKIHGADAQFLNGMKEAGIRGLSFDTLVALKIHGADPRQVKELADLGFKNLSAEEVVATRIHGVTPDYIREIRKRGFKDLTLEQIIQLKQLGILEQQKSL
jgi:beta-lactamase regulating signal transducer with metallopeptidase domain